MEYRVIKKIGLVEAILAINPKAQVNIHNENYDTIDWNAGTAKITKADIDAKILELEAEWTAQEYARKRQAEYPSVGDQLDMLMKDMKNNTTTHRESCEAVKAQFPKP